MKTKKPKKSQNQFSANTFTSSTHRGRHMKPLGTTNTKFSKLNSMDIGWQGLQ